MFPSFSSCFIFSKVFNSVSSCVVWFHVFMNLKVRTFSKVPIPENPNNDCIEVFVLRSVCVLLFTSYLCFGFGVLSEHRPGRGTRVHVGGLQLQTADGGAGSGVQHHHCRRHHPADGDQRRKARGNAAATSQPHPL